MFTVANSGRISVTLHLMGRTPTADFRISDSAGRPVWSLLRDQTMLGALRLYPLDPAKRLTFHQTWDQRADTGGMVPSGEYVIRGVLLTDDPGGLASPPVRLLIER